MAWVWGRQTADQKWGTPASGMGDVLLLAASLIRTLIAPLQTPLVRTSDYTPCG
ncbi:hypothetical protein [Izhakiella capsodis]|uniref:hypothetical protein n=1 Tax=Izhakiella capsodis TaxID=1367852 RepID=UPI0015A6B254|nr:hypothetical protein [Izhakiella capsodis]